MIQESPPVTDGHFLDTRFTLFKKIRSNKILDKFQTIAFGIAGHMTAAATGLKNIS